MLPPTRPDPTRYVVSVEDGSGRELLIALRYDDRDGLIARGIAVDPPAPRHVRGPGAFPRKRRFAPPPPVWD